MRSRLRFIAPFLIAALPGLVSAQDKFFNSKGVQIRYVEQGSGAPIVLVHGYESNIETAWVKTGVFANLSKDHHVIALDLRGHGNSGKPHVAKAYGNEMSEDIVRLMDHLKIQRAHIIGYSMGGRVVEKLLTAHPDRFLTAVLGGFGLLDPTRENDAALEKRAAETESGSFRTVILSTWPSDQPPPTEEVIRQLSQERIARGSDPVALAQVVRGFPDLRVSSEQMSAVHVPILAVVGSADPLLAEVNHLKMAMPSLKLVVIQGATHSGERGAVSRPEFVNAIREFVGAQKTSQPRPL